MDDKSEHAVEGTSSTRRKRADSGGPSKKRRRKRETPDVTGSSNGEGTPIRRPCFSNMLQPSLIRQLRCILAEYPDGGQIIKELIQNAEDAGARKVKILFDNRRVNHGADDDGTIFNRFFQGPAVCVYNDAEFSEEDWQGIQMISSSIKENNKLKVGRFGLGFKSVFHITDYPCIISGTQMLLIDPQQLTEKSLGQSMMQLNQLPDMEGVTMDTILTALDGCFSFSRQTLQEGRYNGTLLRFPLREQKSELSETLYKESKILDLFDEVMAEATSILTFLRNLESIELYAWQPEKTIECTVKIRIDDANGELRRTREKFKQDLKLATESETFQDDIQCPITMEISTETQTQTTQTRWLIVNYVIGQSASEEFRRLIRDEHLGYSPCVGVAMCLDDHQSIDGHVFCFLPLPKEGLSHTGLPFHINGFFAMSQNRHHLKWATEEQKGKTIYDKSILWNERMITEALPRAYQILLDNAIQLSEQSNNQQEDVNVVYKLFPDVTKTTDDKWLRIADEALTMLKEQNVVYCRHARRWITLSEAIFVILPEQLSYVKTAVEECLATVGKHYVDIPLETYKTIKAHFSTKITSLTPEILASFLRQDQTYTSLKDEHKIHILTYLLSGQDCNTIRGLQLLPLASGEWTNFDQNGPAVYVCKPDEVRLFPKMENKFLRPDTSLGTVGRKLIKDDISSNRKSLKDKDGATNVEHGLVDTLQLPLETGEFQLQHLSDNDCVQLLKDVMETQIPKQTITAESPLGLDWLQEVWKMITERNFEIIKFQEIPLLPILVTGTWTSSQYTVNLVPLSTKNLLLKEHTSHGSIDTGVCSCLELLGVTILPQLPQWISLDTIQRFIWTNTHEHVSKMLSCVASKGIISQRASRFNKDVEESWKIDFVKFLRGHSEFDKNTIELLSRLQVFHQVKFSKGPGESTSVADTSYYFEDHQADAFPESVTFPFPCLRIKGSERELVQQLGGIELTVVVFVRASLQNIHDKEFTEQTWNIMKYFIGNFGKFDTNSDIIALAKQIRFLPVTNGRVRAMDVFDPSDTQIASLFAGQNLLPNATEDVLNLDSNVLKKLGMKTIHHVTNDELLSVARKLDAWTSEACEPTEAVKEKADAFLHFIESHPACLKGTNGLVATITNIACINCDQVKPVGVKYPSCMEWYSHPMPLCKPSEAVAFDHWQLVGSTMPLVNTAIAEVAELFGWRAKPPTGMVMEQLEKIRYSPQDEDSTTDILPVLKTIYEDMTDRQAEYLTYKQVVVEKSLIWTDGGFTSPSRTIVSHDDMTDVEVRPYFQYIPQAFHRWSKLFQSLGCHELQDVGILVSTLHDVADKYKDKPYDEATVKKDRRLVVGILNRLAELRQDDQDDFPDKDLLIMVQHEDERMIHFAAVNECVFDNEPDLFNDEIEECIKYVHRDMETETVVNLGVKSLTKKSLLDSEDVGLSEWGQKEKLTSRIKSLLQYGYTDGFPVAKELIQNADDARASVVKFLYDERRNEDARERLFTRALGECQGPALWVYNDAQFSQDDLKNITKLNGGTKSHDTQTIGKFGLGFCSVYNLTEVPSFITGRHMVMFDPHETYLQDAAKAGGLKVDLTNKTLVKRHAGQFKPFQGVFGCSVVADSFEPFDGTLFRLPLRTEMQAYKSEMSQKVYTSHEMQELLGMLNEAMGNILLYSQNINEIQVFHLSADAVSPAEMTPCFNIKKKCLSLTNEPIPPMHSRILERASMLDDDTDFLETQVVCLEQHIEDKAFSQDSSTSVDKSGGGEWLVSWAMCRDQDNQTPNPGVLPLAAIASPVVGINHIPTQVEHGCGSVYSKGHLFCFMPLPVQTDLPIHINGNFEVTDNRKGLASLTEDDKSNNVSGWNGNLMETSVVKAFLQQLTAIANQKDLEDYYAYDTLWPRGYNQCVEPFVKAFYRTLLEEIPCVFKSDEGYVSFNRIVFLDPAVYDDEDIGQTAFEMLQNIPIKEGKVAVVIDAEILKLLETHNPDKHAALHSAQITKEAMLHHFLTNIDNSFWAEAIDERNSMLRHALMANICSVDQILKHTKCVPVEPSGHLMMVHQIVHPCSRLAKLFAVSDGRFPNESWLSKDTDILLGNLVRLGMMDQYMPSAILAERCQSIKKIADQCSICTMERIQQVMKYIADKKVLTELKEDPIVLAEIKDSFLLPVLKRPDDWCFSWKSEQDCSGIKQATNQQCIDRHMARQQEKLIIGKPKVLYREKETDCVGIHQLVLNEDPFNDIAKYSREHTWQTLCIRQDEDLTVKDVMMQLDSVADTHDAPQVNVDVLERVCVSIYKVLNRNLDEDSDTEFNGVNNEFDGTLKKHIVLIGQQLLRPNSVVVKLYKECSPDLVKLNKSSFERVFVRFGVKEEIHVDDVIHILKEKTVQLKDRACDSVQIRNIGCLLDNLYNCMTRDNLALKDIHDDKRKFIVAPDNQGFLVKSVDLALEDSEFQTFKKVRLLHGDCITPVVAKAIGVQSKKAATVRKYKTMKAFGQKEELSTRLNGLLQDYPCDESIMKELIQNADDAGATELHFIKHYDTQELKHPFGSETKRGPALCIYNDSYFREEDFQGIKNLGIGSKSDDPCSTGQYGLGFNSVYHLTDVPSFVSKGPGLGEMGTLCIFDPLGVDIEEFIDSDPGIRCEMDEVSPDFPELIDGYLHILETKPKGTVFRLPLRNRESKISKNCITNDAMDKILNEFIVNMKECLHFVKHIKCIKVLSYRDGKLNPEYSVLSTLSKDDELKRKQFFDQVRETSRANIVRKENNLDVTPFDVAYTMQIKDMESCEDWYIVNRFGGKPSSNETNMEEIKNAFRKSELGLLPLAGVSTRLNKPKVPSDFECPVPTPPDGIAFCFLPLPVKTGLPFHVNGHFAVGRNRRGLLDNGERKAWNGYILQTLVVEAVYTTLKHLQLHYIDRYTSQFSKAELMNKCFDMYHSHFPLIENVKNDGVWDALVKAFYSDGWSRKFELYPVVTADTHHCTGVVTRAKTQPTSRHTPVSVKWVSLATDCDDVNGGVFNTVHKQESSKINPVFTADVTAVLKAMHMNLIETPDTLRETMIKAGLTSVVESDPDFVAKFLKTADVVTDILIEQTVFKSIRRLKNVIEYVSPGRPSAWMRDLPLNLTNDGILRVFPVDGRVLCSEYCDLLEASSDQFVHRKMVKLVSKLPSSDAVFTKLSVDVFTQLLPKSVDPSIYRTGKEIEWNPEEGIGMSGTNLDRIFEFIFKESFTRNPPFGFNSLSNEQFQKNLDQLNDWSFLPAVVRVGDLETKRLVPIQQAYLLIGTANKTLKMNSILAKLNLPQLDTETFKSGTVIPDALQMVLASTDNAGKLLRCLAHYKQNIVSSDINKGDARCVLRFFQNELDTLRRIDWNGWLNNLKSLPLFENTQGQLVDIRENAMIMPTGMPMDGLDALFAHVGTTALTSYHLLEMLYKELQLRFVTSEELYAETIMPNFQSMPEKVRMIHIRHVKENIVNTDLPSFNINQHKIVNLLKAIPFINVNGKMKRVNELYSREHELFKCMMNQDCLIPESYSGWCWRSFLKMLDLKTKPSSGMVLNFAKEIAAAGASTSELSKKLKEKSTCVTECLFGNHGDAFDDNFYEEIKRVKFVVPHGIVKAKQNIFRPHSDGQHLVCLFQSISKEWEDVCWTSLSLLKICPTNRDISAKLGIMEEPTVTKVIQHCQNICDEFRKALRSNDTSSQNASKFENYMEPIYKFLDGKKADIRREKAKLEQTPVVLIPGEAMMRAHCVVTGASRQEDEIKPYLYNAPKCFRPFFDVFEILGASASATCAQFAAVLQEISKEYDNNKLLPCSLDQVTKAVCGFFKRLSDNAPANEINETQVLYLPNQNHVMRLSTDLTVCDNKTFKKMIGNKVDIDYFVGFEELDIGFSNPVAPFKHLPDNLKARFLSDDVSEHVDMSEMVETEDSMLACRWEEFVRSQELQEGIVRLLRHAFEDTVSGRYNETKESGMLERLACACVKQVTGLKTFLKYKDHDIEGTDRHKECFVTDLPELVGVQQKVLYFNTMVGDSDDAATKTLRRYDGVQDLIHKCMPDDIDLDKQGTLLLKELLEHLDDPLEIGATLDRERIPPYTLILPNRARAFPRPGTAVDLHFYPFLVQSLVPFEEHEFKYAAMELDAEDDEEELYIYVNIKRELRRVRGRTTISIMYEVDVGRTSGTLKRVPIYQLYRFVRPQVRDPGQEVQVYDGEPVGSVPVDENYRRVQAMLKEAWEMGEAARKKIIKRLLLRWHPDRNRGNEDYARMVFIYIKEVVAGLEREHSVTDSKYSNWSSRIDRTGKVFARSYQTDYVNYNNYRWGRRYHRHSYNSSSGRSCAPIEPRPNKAEARKWMKQAKCDFATGRMLMQSKEEESFQGYNWICYICHQACEKALKAAWYAKDANRVFLLQHSLSTLASNLDGSFMDQATRLETALGVSGRSYSVLRYPDSVADKEIPADLFDEEKAKIAIDATKQLLKDAQEVIEI